MTRDEEYRIQIEDAKIEYSSIWKISDIVFTQKAGDILNIPINQIQVRRSILSDENFGKLNVFVFNNCENQEYYHLHVGEYVYEHLPTNIDEFAYTLKRMLTTKTYRSKN